MPIVLSNDELTARKATDISQWISTHSDFDSIRGDESKVSSILNKEENKPYCYSCSKIVDLIKL